MSLIKRSPVSGAHPGGFGRPDGQAVSPRRFAALASLIALLAFALLPAGADAAGVPIVTETDFKEVTTTSATFDATLDPNGANTSPYHFEYVDQAGFEASGFDTAEAGPDGPVLSGTTGQPVSATVQGLHPGTIYHVRLFAHNAKGDAAAPERIFATYSLPPTSGPCPNEAFRSGVLSPPGHPAASLPDCRAYEQASPVDKNGGDVLDVGVFAKASSLGDGAIFGSTFSVPGGEGSPDLPTFQGMRGPEGWSSFGQFPPPSFGDSAGVLGWLPDFSKTFLSATRLGSPKESALLQRSGDGSPPVQLTPYIEGGFEYSGASRDGNEVVFQAEGRLPAEVGGPPLALSNPDAKNVYLYDEATGKMSLVSVLNTPEETESRLPEGAFSGPYDWGAGTNALHLKSGGDSYQQEMRSVGADGSVFFTAAGTGQLYERVNPTQPQSALDGEGACTEPGKGCTYHLSQSRRTPPDPAGSAPAAFQAASADGGTAYFTSAEKLTEDANTGPDQPAPEIGRAGIDGKTEEPSWMAGRRAVGLAVDSEYIYWADPVDGTIGRAELDGANANDEFIVPGPVTVEEEIEKSGGGTEILTEEVPSKPRYVAVDAGHIYWTDTADGQPGHGTIGRADINGSSESVEPECVRGASDPQGIAVDAEHIYWANATIGANKSIGRANTDCTGAVQDFQDVRFGSAEVPYGVALSAGEIYWTGQFEGGDSLLNRVPLSGGVGPGEVEQMPIGTASQLRGLAVQGEDLYWAALGEDAIGHVVWPEAEPATTPENEFLPLDTGPVGLAADAGHLYWSTNGETTPNPGNDLYRFRRDGFAGCGRPTGCLDDLTPDAAGDGAEVQGVLGASPDGSLVYFAANGDLDGTGPAEAGTCTGPPSKALGQCNLYLWQAGAIKFIARIDAEAAQNWAPSPGVLSGAQSQLQKTSFISADGETLLLSTGELYRDGEPTACVTCDPVSGAPAPTTATSISTSFLTRINYPTLRPLSTVAALQSRMLSADGDRAYFETTRAMVAADTDGAGGCPTIGTENQVFPVCLDVYEWEAPGTASCSVGGPAYSPLNSGCLYLLSPGDSAEPALFSDASASGDDVFFFTPERLVGQDQDGLFDLYDARVEGGLASQNPPPSRPPCEAEGCKPAASAAPGSASPATPSFQGPGNVKQPKPCPKGKLRRHGKCVPSPCPKGKVRRHDRCVKRHTKKHHSKNHRHHAKRAAHHNRGGAK